MKKLKFYLLITLIITGLITTSTIITSCDKDDKKTDNPDPKPDPKPIPPTQIAIGDTIENKGIVGYIFQSGDPGYISGETHGIIVSKNSISDAKWGCKDDSQGAIDTALGTGQINTTKIVNGCDESNIAARQCDNSIEDTHNDWYLPSKDELNKLFINKVAIKGFVNMAYWSSTEKEGGANNRAFIQNFRTGNQFDDSKDASNRARCIRNF